MELTTREINANSPQVEMVLKQANQFAEMLQNVSQQLEDVTKEKEAAQSALSRETHSLLLI